jgi:hypothetical protein
LKTKLFCCTWLFAETLIIVSIGSYSTVYFITSAHLVKFFWTINFFTNKLPANNSIYFTYISALFVYLSMLVFHPNLLSIFFVLLSPKENESIERLLLTTNSHSEAFLSARVPSTNWRNKNKKDEKGLFRYFIQNKVNNLG